MDYAWVVFGLIVGWAEGYKFARDHPIQISVFDLLIVLVLRNVKLLVVEPAESDSVLQSSQAIQNLYFWQRTVHL